MTRWRGTARAAGIALLAAAAAGCAMPVSIPLGPFSRIAGGDEPDPIVTGSIDTTGPTVEETGISSRIGIGAWPALRQAVVAAVQRGEDGQTFSWQSEQGMTGTVTPVAAYFGDSGDICRSLAITAARSDASDVFVAQACRNGDDIWSVTPTTGDA